MTNTKLSVPVAVNHRTRLGLPSDHLTTGEFLVLQPIMYRHCVSTEKLHNKYVGNVRPFPLALPTFGNVTAKVRHFFVPYRLLMPKYKEFYSTVLAHGSSASSIPYSVPYFNSETLVDLFVNSFFGNTTLGTASDYDFESLGSYYKLTTDGKRKLKILESLGYAIVPRGKTFKFNAFGLLAFARVWCDWYANDQYLNSTLYNNVMQFFNYIDPVTPLELNSTNLDEILNVCLFVNYDSNGYFEAAWDNPTVPNSGQSVSFDVSDIVGLAEVKSSSDNIPFIQVGTDGSSGTQFLHDSLQRVAEYQMRNGLAGARSINRLLATFGKVQPDEELNRSIYLGFDDLSVDIGDVVATANGTNGVEDSSVGDYAGIGFGKGNGSIEYDCKEDGVYLVVQSIIPSGGYFQGYDRNNRHLLVEDFYNPTLELATQAVERGEVYVSRHDAFANNDPNNYTNTFGFVGRYGEYKRSINRVTGDIALPRIYDGGHAWHVMRMFNDVSFSGLVDNVRHTHGFTQGLDGFTYNRIFQYTDIDRDHFICYYHFDLKVDSPMRSLFDTFDWLEETKRITMNSNGVTLN